MKISGSILAAKDNYMEYARQLKYESVDFLHIDIFESVGEFRLEQLLDFDDGFLPLDVHLIFNTITNQHIEILNKSKISYLNIQYEKLEDKHIIPELVSRIKANVGLAFTMDTPESVIEDNLKYCSQILFMCSEPGVSGAKFNNDNFERIESFHMKYPNIMIEVDGGIDDIRAKQMAEIGASIAVSGSFLAKNVDSIYVNSYRLKYKDDKDAIAKHIMIPYALLPIAYTHSDIFSVVDIMNKYRLGIVFIVDENENLKGIIADGDIRRGFIKYHKEIFDVEAACIMNSNPYKVMLDDSIKKIYRDISNLHKGIEVIPVMDGTKIIGAVDLKVGK